MGASAVCRPACALSLQASDAPECPLQLQGDISQQVGGHGSLSTGRGRDPHASPRLWGAVSIHAGALWLGPWEPQARRPLEILVLGEGACTRQETREAMLLMVRATLTPLGTRGRDHRVQLGDARPCCQAGSLIFPVDSRQE